MPGGKPLNSTWFVGHATAGCEIAYGRRESGKRNRMYRHPQGRSAMSVVVGGPQTSPPGLPHRPLAMRRRLGGASLAKKPPALPDTDVLPPAPFIFLSTRPRVGGPCKNERNPHKQRGMPHESSRYRTAQFAHPDKAVHSRATPRFKTSVSARSRSSCTVNRGDTAMT